MPSASTAFAQGSDVTGHDPFGLTGFGVADVAGRPGEKWQKVDGRLASWVADMDFPIAPAIVERLSRRVAIDVGYPTWDDVSRSPLPERFAERMSVRYGWSRNRRVSTSWPMSCRASPWRSTISARRATAWFSTYRRIRRFSS